MFADNFVGLITNTEDLQTLINLVQEFMVFSIEVDTGTFTRKWGDKDIPRVSSYSFLGIEFVNNGSMDRHVEIVNMKGKNLITYTVL